MSTCAAPQSISDDPPEAGWVDFAFSAISRVSEALNAAAGDPDEVPDLGFDDVAPDGGDEPAVSESAKVSVDSRSESPDLLRMDRISKIPAHRLILLLKLCRGFGTEERLRQTCAPSAITLVSGTADLTDVCWVLRKLVPEWRFEAGSDARRFPRQVNVGAIDRDGDGPVRRLHPWGDLLRDGGPIVLTVKPATQTPRTLEVLKPLRIELGRLDGEFLRFLLGLKFPGTTSECLADLPGDRELAQLDEDLLPALLRLPDPAAVVAAVCQAAQPKRQAGIPLRELAGLGEAREIAIQMVEDLALWARGQLDWSQVCRGLLLVGPPGCGKTELGRAMAREGGLTFISGSYASWQSNGHLGDFLKAMQKDFADAVARRPAVLFIDEIDAFSIRSRRDGRNDSYDMKAVAGFLEQLDGVAGREGVVVLAACNHAEELDPAVMRSGRFDSVVAIGLPSHDDLRVILKQHLQETLSDAAVERLAALAVGRSGADCAAAIRLAGAAARRDSRPLGEQDIVRALVGDHGTGFSREDLHILSIHECGHAIAAAALLVGRPMSLRLASGGGEMVVQHSAAVVRKSDLHRKRVVDLAGRAAEILIFGEASAGAGGPAQSDLAKATRSAMEQETCLGLGEFGPVWFGTAHDTLSALQLSPALRDRVRNWIETAEADATRILERNRDLLDRMADLLIEQRVISGQALADLLAEVVRD